ncbi:MAG TPA: hypothetical protein VFW64_12200 [Pseudonocardiaceae bacterium]|nr:hypothetical protein [Pseudonocardiaceae bacterium]
MTPSALVEPAYFHCPDYHKTFGPEVGELAGLIRFPADPEQQMILDAQFAVDKKGRSAAFEVCVICCRQNLKTGWLKIAALGKTVIMERPLFVWSAHEFRTSQEGFRDLTVLIESTPDLDQMVKKIHYGNGDEAIEFLGGQRIIFKARTNAGGRGLTGDDVGLDEAFALKPEHMGALLPTLSARPDPQVAYGSSAGLVQSEVLRQIRDRGRAGNSPRLVYIEWCAPEGGCQHEQCDHSLDAQECALDDEDNWRRANPALGRRITMDYVRAERQALPPAEFGRERLGWWDDPASENMPISLERWASLEDAAAPMESVRAFAAEVSLDRAWASIGAAGPAGDGRVALELIERRRGIGWVLDAFIALDEDNPVPIVVDGGGPAASLIPAMQAAGLTVIVANARDVAAACAGVVDGAAETTICHGPQPELDQAVAGAKKRPLGDGAFAFGRKVSTADIDAFMSVALAHWAAREDRAPEVWSIAEMVDQLRAEQEAAKAKKPDDEEPNGDA